MSEVAAGGYAAPQEMPHHSAPVGLAPAAKASKKRGKKGDESGEEAKKSPKKKIIILCVVLLLVGYEAKGKLMKPHYGPHQKVPAGAVYELGSTTITTNLSDGHLAQIGISLQLTKAANSKQINTDTSQLTNSTIKILSGDTYNALLGPAGRAALASELLGAYQKDLGRSEGAQQVSAVYFTAFVLQ